MKYKILISILTLFSTFILTSNVFAVSTSDNADKTYLYNCGYSKEIIRVVEDEKDRAQSRPVKPESRLNRFIKNLFYEPDYTEHTELFGRRRIMSK